MKIEMSIPSAQKGSVDLIGNPLRFSKKTCDVSVSAADTQRRSGRFAGYE